jgi:lipopolysaccharide transport system ATP-binding protein
MVARLGFSVAVHTAPDVLLVDEVLAVGDAAFQNKCLSRVQELRRGGASVLFVSHDMEQVRRACERAILLRRGSVEAAGEVSLVADAYETSLVAARSEGGALR